MSDQSLISLFEVAAVPVATVTAGCVAWAASRLSTWLATKTKNALVLHVATAASTIAGDISDTLAALPVGTTLADARRSAISQGVRDLKSLAQPELTKLGLSDDTLKTIISGELGKLNAANPSMPSSVAATVQPPTASPGGTSSFPPGGGL